MIRFLALFEPGTRWWARCVPPAGRGCIMEASLLPGVWLRSSLADGYVLQTEDGAAFGLPAGRVFVHLVRRPLLAD